MPSTPPLRVSSRILGLIHLLQLSLRPADRSLGAPPLHRLGVYVALEVAQGQGGIGLASSYSVPHRLHLPRSFRRSRSEQPRRSPGNPLNGSHSPSVMRLTP